MEHPSVPGHTAPIAQRILSASPGARLFTGPLGGRISTVVLQPVVMTR